MAYTIISSCTACGLCLPTCPIDAITAGDRLYAIDQELCCDFEDCLAVCPVDAILPSAVAAIDRQTDASPAPPAGPAL